MQHIARWILLPLLVAGITVGAWAKEGATATAPAAEYKRSDTNFYWKGDVLKVYPSAVILAAGSYTKKDDSYFFTPHKKAPKVLWVEVHNDWIEPITPPDMPASLGVPPDAMQIREPQGDVQVALPSAPASFAPVTDGMTIPNGAVIKTGANATAAVLFGGVDSARLIPNSAAAVQQTVTAKSRSVEVDLTSGGVFSKVGKQEGVTEDYEVQTPSGAASARGTDFVTVAMPTRTDVWIAQGTVELTQPNGKVVGSVSAEGTGALKIIRFPLMPDPHQTMMADAETMTDAMNFIPMADQKIEALRAKITRGETLTANEQAYLKRIKQVPCLIKLALVETTAAPAPVPAVTTPPATPASTNLKPLTVVVHPNGTIGFRGSTLGLLEFQAKLKAMVKATPDQSLLIKSGTKVPYEKLKAVLDSCADAQVQHVSIVPPAPMPTPAPMPPPVAPAAAEPAATNPPAPPPTTVLKPIRAIVRVDGKVNFQGATYELPGFKAKLEAIVKATPDQAIAVKAGKTVSYEKFQAVMDICHSAEVKNLSVISPAPTPEPVPPAAAEPATNNLPAPTLLMHPSMEPMPGTVPPEAPSAPPATNTPPPVGP